MKTTTRARRKRGRPASSTAKRPLATRLAADVLDYLRTTDSIAEAIEASIRSTYGYRAWLARVAPATATPPQNHFPESC